MLANSLNASSQRDYLQEVGGFLKAEVYVHTLKSGQKVVSKDYSRFAPFPLAAWIAKWLVKREYQALEGLQHWPYAPKAIPSDNPLILRQELIEGKTLKHYVDSGKPAPLKRCLMDVVQEMHLQGWVHNDVRGSNVIVTRDGQPVLIDFTSAHHFSNRSSKLARLLRFHDVRHSLKIKNRLLGNLSERQSAMLVKSKWLEVPHGFWRNKILPMLKAE